MATGKWIVRLMLLMPILAVTSCGLAVTDQERLERASAEMENGEYRAAMIQIKSVLANDADNFDARILLATVSLGLDDVAAAEKELSRASELGAPESAVLPVHLEILLAKRDFDAALAAMGMSENVLTPAEQWRYTGRALLGLGNSEAALRNYSEWLEASPDAAEAVVGVARARLLGGHVMDAIQSLEEAVETEPQDFDAWHVLGMAHLQAGELVAAEETFDRAADAIPREAFVRQYGMVLADLASVQMSLDRLEDARRTVRRLGGVYPNSPTTLWLAARLARLDMDYAQAARILQSLLNEQPDNSGAQLLLANVQMMQGNYAQAEALLERVVAQTPDNVQARKLLAQIQLQRAQPEGAIEALAPILEEHSSDREIYELLAQVSLQTGDARAAIDNFRAIVEQAPGDISARMNLAAAYIHAQEPALALEVLDAVPVEGSVGFRRDALLMAALLQSGRKVEADAIATDLIKSHGQDGAAISAAASYFLAAGETGRAKGALEARVQAVSDDVGALMALARIELDAGNLDRADEYFVAARDADNANIDALLGRARVAELRGQESIVDEMLLQAVQLQRNDARPLIWLASRRLVGNKIAEAEKFADQAVAIGYRSARMGQIVGRIYLTAGRLDEAVLQFSDSVRVAPDLPTLQWDLARAYLALGRTVEAKAALNRARQSDSDWLPAVVTLALVELRQGNVDAALAYVAELKSSHPGNSAVQVLEGEISLYQGEYESAARAFHRAVAMGAGRLAMLKEFQSLVNGRLPDPDRPIIEWLADNPDDLRTRLLIAEYYQKLDARDSAVQEYERILQQDPDNVAVLNNLAWQYQQKGKLPQALDLASRAYELDKNSGSIADTLAWIHYELGNLEQSLELLKAAVTLSPDNGEIGFHYAVVLSQTGDIPMARSVLTNLQERGLQFPSRKEAEELLRTL